jgi:hypothetical protein
VGQGEVLRGVLAQLRQVRVHALKHHVEVVKVAEVYGGVVNAGLAHVKHVHDIGVFQLGEDLDLRGAGRGGIKNERGGKGERGGGGGFRQRTSRYMRFAFSNTEKMSMMRLMATFLPVRWSIACTTLPYDPLPNSFFISKRSWSMSQSVYPRFTWWPGRGASWYEREGMG